MNNRFNRPRIIGWVAVSFSSTITSFWAFWGIIENFHEGWYYESLPMNIGLMFAQYLGPMIIFMGITLISIKWPRFGGGLHVVISLFAAWFFQIITNPGLLLLIAPLIVLGVLYWFGRPQPRKIAVALAVGLPFLTLMISGIEPVFRVSQRIDDGNHQARLVHGNGVDLIWASEGPGWPSTGDNWHEAQLACQHLSEDGLTIEPSLKHFWRLPTVDEVVRSMARHGKNSCGEWNDNEARASYATTPDKESPLWDIYSPVIYWWTATEIDDNTAFMIEYDGQVWPRKKFTTQTYFGFRCVRDMESK